MALYEKMAEHEQNMARLKKKENQHKQELVNKIIMKANRGREIITRKTKVADMALQNSIHLRDTY